MCRRASRGDGSNSIPVSPFYGQHLWFVGVPVVREQGANLQLCRQLLLLLEGTGWEVGGSVSEAPNASDEEEEEELVEAGCWFWTIAEGLKAFVVSESVKEQGFCLLPQL